jgi:Ni,Fe-hydrogenase III large subunit
VSYSLVLGPFHPFWRGPQRFVLHVDGEHVTDVQYTDGYNERGCAERLTRLDLPQALHLVTRICGVCSFAHSLAFCQALEQLCDMHVPQRAAYLRVVTAELERVVSHLQTAALTLTSLGMEQRATMLNQIREVALHAQKLFSGGRVIPDMCLPGGMKRDVTPQHVEELLVVLLKLNRMLYQVTDELVEHRALLSRTVGVGTLPRAAAEQFGVRGTLGRASGVARDARIDHPYAAYDCLDVQITTQEGGDVYARLMLLLLESLESIRLAEQALQELPDGAWQGAFPDELRIGQGSGVVEGPRGLLRYTLESDGRKLTQARIDTPRQIDRLLARTFLSGALVDNIVPIVVSCDVCTACAEK